MSSSSSVAVKRRRLNKKTPAEGAAAAEPSSEDEILDAVEVAAIAARVDARARHYTRPTRVEAGLGQNIFVKQVVSLGGQSFLGAVISFVCF